MDTATIAIIVSALGVIFSLIFNLVAVNRNNKQETKEKATSIAVLNSDMGYVKSGIDDIKAKQSDTDNAMRDFATRVTQAEDSAKSAHHRLDNHETRIVQLEHDRDKE